MCIDSTRPKNPRSKFSYPSNFWSGPKIKAPDQRPREGNLGKILFKRVGTVSPRHQRGQGEKTRSCSFQNSNSPEKKNVTYGKIVCEMKPEKEKTERTTLKVGTWPYLSPWPLWCLGLTVPTRLKKIFSQTFLSGPLIRCLYSWATPEIWLVTEFALRVFGHCAVNAYLL